MLITKSLYASLHGKLFRNELVIKPDGTRSLRFTDVTTSSGIVARGYGMGVAAGDFDNDGWADLFLTNLGPTQLWRNNRNGTFTEVTKKAGVETSDWSTSAAWVDYDRDGWLDLFVCHYVNFTTANNKKCYSPTTRRDYCTPRAYDPMAAVLFHNRGDGTFENVSTKSGIASEKGNGLGVICADFNEDGWPDFYVANDQLENFLWMNQRNGTFKNEALLAGCAVSRDGKPEASMGVDAGDVDGDGDEDLFMTHLADEKNTLYLNLGQGMFEDRSYESGVGNPAVHSTAFGTLLFDYDNDGWLDIFIANGAVTIIEALAAAQDPFPFHQSNQLFRNQGNGAFKETTQAGGAVFKLSEVGRGAAFGDVDNDGDTDVLIVNNNGPVRLLLNQIGNRQHWVGLRLLEARAQRDALGAKVFLSRKQKPDLSRRVRTDGSYLSSHDARVLFGLGNTREPVKVLVAWPSGRWEEWNHLALDKYTTLQEGSGKAAKPKGN
ncbi:MAG: CRTAC1 family protein [Acidobacteria bacterium]|nr:CRTAC1 family protein [Acidobacteriota bacterium]